MCATTPSVEEICSKNNVNLVQLLQPFSQLDNIRIYPYKTESGQSSPKQITSLSLKFVSIYEISEIAQESSDKYLAEYCRKLAPKAPIQLTHLKSHKRKEQQQQQEEDKKSINDDDDDNSALRICSVSDVDRFFISNPDPTPWFSLYQKKFLSTLQFNDYEFLDAPIGIMYIASTRDDDPVEKLKKLSSKSNLPSKFKNGIYSSEMHKVFILLHDKHDIDLRSRVQFLFQNVCKSFDGYSCKLLHINSNNFNNPNYDNIDLWQQYINNDGINIEQYPLPKSIIENYNNTHCKRSWSKGKNYYINNKTNKHGIYLSDQDISVLTQFVSDFCIYGIIPFIEKKISKLYLSISKQRRGTINTFKTWIRSTKIKPHIEERLKKQNCIPIYQLHTIESQIRQLADLSFIFQQYHLALDHYKLCQTDYENDQTKLYLSGCLEMSGLCCALLSNPISTPSWMKSSPSSTTTTSTNNGTTYTNGHTHTNGHNTNTPNNNNNELDEEIIDRRDMEKYYDTGFRLYCDIINGTSRATRTCIWAWMSHSSLGHSFNNDMISNVLLRPSEKETKHRSAMLLEQAAFAYLRAGQDRSPCIRKYAFHLILAAHLYKECEQKQHSIRCYSRAMMVYAERGWNHIEDHINYNLGYLSSKVLRYNPAIEYFLELLGEGRGSSTRQKNFLDKFISIISKWPNNNNIMIKEIGILSSNSISKTLKFVPNLNIPKFDANKILIILNDPNLLQTNYCIVGEPIIVQFPIHNPLKRTLIVSNLCLHIDILSSSSSTTKTIPTILGYDDLFEYQPSNITLNSSETKLFSLSIIPKNNILCGFKIKIVGIRWQIFDCMQGFYKFENAFHEIKLSSKLSNCSFLKYGKKSIATFKKDHRSIEYYLNDIDNKINLIYNVQQPIAHLIANFDDKINKFPSNIYFGELCPVILNIKNISNNITAYNLNLQINKPTFLTICNLKTNKLYENNLENNNINFNQNIKPNQTLKLLIWIYGSEIGRHLIQFHFKYQTSDKILKRTTIISRYLTINPFMNISLFTKDHFGDINQYILGIEIENNYKENILLNKGEANNIKTIQLKDLTKEEKENVILPSLQSTLSSITTTNNNIQIEYIGCYSSVWNIQKLIKDNNIPNINSMSTLTTFVKLVPNNDKNNKNNDVTVVHFGGDDNDNDNDNDERNNILNPLNDICQNIFKLKQKEHENRLRHIARVFHHIRQKHKNELEIIVSFKMMNKNDNDNNNDKWYNNNGRFGYLLLREPFVFARHETLSNCPLRVALKYPKKIPISSLSTECDVTLMVLNTGTKYVTFILETLKQNEEFDSHQRSFIINDNPSSRSKYSWIGNTRFENELLEPGGYSSYNLKAKFNQPGIYNLNRYRFIVQTHSNDLNSIKKTNPSKIFFFPTQHLCIVGSSD